MTEPTDFKNREYRMIRGTYPQLIKVIRELITSGWEPERVGNAEWADWAPANFDTKRVWVLPFSRPKEKT